MSTASKLKQAEQAKAHERALLNLESPAQLLRLARQLARQVFPSHAPLLDALTFVERPGLGTFAVDQKCRMYWDPAVVIKWRDMAVAVSPRIRALSPKWHGSTR